MDITTWPIISILILVILAVFLVIFIRKLKRGEAKASYKTLFAIGLSWTPLGIVFIAIDSNLGLPLFSLGLIFLIVGLINKNKWEEKKELTSQQRKMMVALTIIGLVVFLVALYFYLNRA